MIMEKLKNHLLQCTNSNDIDSDMQFLEQLGVTDVADLKFLNSDLLKHFNLIASRKIFTHRLHKLWYIFEYGTVLHF